MQLSKGISPAAAVVLGRLKAALRPMWRQLGLKLKILVPWKELAARSMIKDDKGTEDQDGTSDLIGMIL